MVERRKGGGEGESEKPVSEVGGGGGGLGAAHSLRTGGFLKGQERCRREPVPSSHIGRHIGVPRIF